MKAVESRLEYCQRKAAEARARAEAMKDFEARRAMLEVAAMWDEMADVAERSSPSRLSFPSLDANLSDVLTHLSNPLAARH